MRKTYFFEKNSFFEKMSFFQNSEFFHLFCQPTPVLWVSTQPPCHCGHVGTHHWGVQSGFRCLQTNLKIKTGKFYHFQIQFFCHNSAKNSQKCPKSKSPNPSNKNLCSHQISAHLAFKWPRKSKKSTFLQVLITKVIRTPKKVYFFNFLGHLKTK